MMVEERLPEVLAKSIAQMRATGHSEGGDTAKRSGRPA